jgi:hypothetical protein
MKEKYLPGIQIRIDEHNSQRIKKWLSDIDWEILANGIEKNGGVTAFDYLPVEGKRSPRFHRLEKLPAERGRFRPHYGEAGGGFEFHIRSESKGTMLVGTSKAADFHKITPPPLNFLLPNKIEIEVYREPVEWDGFIYPHDNRFIDGENILGFYGDFFRLFHAWEWYSEDTEPFEFTFVPMSIGCLIRVLHIESDETLDLTKDVDW